MAYTKVNQYTFLKSTIIHPNMTFLPLHKSQKIRVNMSSISLSLFKANQVQVISHFQALSSFQISQNEQLLRSLLRYLYSN